MRLDAPINSWTLNLIIFIFFDITALNKANGAKSVLYPATATSNDSHIFLPDGKILHRDKRFLVFTRGGVSKVVLGFSFPVETRDNVNWRTLNLAYNFQAQYVALPSAMYLWDRFSRSLIDQRQRYEADRSLAKDLTRTLIYAALEMLLDRHGRPGRHCLLQAICETAEHPIDRNNVFDEILHLILTPNEHDADPVYVQAKKAGEFCGNCNELYAGCSPADGLLEKISKFF